MQFSSYKTEGFYDEAFDDHGSVRPGYHQVKVKIEELSEGGLRLRQIAAEGALLNLGVTFDVYGSHSGKEHIFPFDIIPRIIDVADWIRIEQGLRQRVEALNEFLKDIYSDQKIIKDGILPTELIYSSKGFLPQCIGLKPPKGIWCHISGIDLVRNSDGVLYVLEDNLRCPSGVSYVLNNRQVMKQTFPELFEACHVRPIDDYPNRLLDTLRHLFDLPDNPTVAILTPGIHNSAYFEHSFLAQQMGIELVEGRDLVYMDGSLKMRTPRGFRRVDVIYRRINDEYLDPSVFRPDSVLGVNGLMRAYREGKVALANAPGTGVADDKAVYAYVPKIIKYYSGEDPILSNVPTYSCWEPSDCEYVLANLDKLVVKSVHESGGYGMLVGQHASKKEIEEFSWRIRENPRSYIAQPTLALSRVSTIIDDHLEGRHVDLRPFILYG
ncbi:MAG: circularly permuted type 2 ATP-grasp protein, partial [Nitrospirae bacterium]|nr:circularly permuted type 2 ATP-grasp protein [Nitrospirota bacterium]